MSFGKLALRVTLGSFFVGHGTQKLFGWFGGHGLEGTAGFFEGQLGLRPGKRHATAAGVAEAAGGGLLILGALTPVAAALLTGTMVTAIRKVHAPNGPWVTESGWEYNATSSPRSPPSRTRPRHPVRRRRLAPQGLAVAAAIAAGVAGSYLATDVVNEAPPEEQDKTDETAARANGIPQPAGAPA